MADVQRYGDIRSEYATVSGMQGLGAGIRETEQALKPFRPKTAPAEDLEKERRAITAEAQQTLIFAQIALFLLVLSLVCYIMLPRDWAHGITFLLLCVGIASGFFLRK